jgi:hypothetical protein
MAQGTACVCSGTRSRKMKHWRVLQYKINYSAFNVGISAPKAITEPLLVHNVVLFGVQKFFEYILVNLPPELP